MNDENPNNKVSTPQATPEPVATPAEPQAKAPSEPIAAAPERAPAASETPASTPAEATAPEAATPAAKACKCKVVNAAEWDKQKKTLNKTFYKTFSPKIFYIPLSFPIDVLRATQGAQKKGYTVVDDGMILDTGGMFMGNVMVEVTGADTKDKNVVSVGEVYCKASRNEYKEIKNDIAELEKEIGGKPSELYIWYTSCPKCMKELY